MSRVHPIRKRLTKLTHACECRGDQFISKSPDEFIEFLLSLIQTFKEHAHPTLKKHITNILKSKSAEEARHKIMQANQISGGGFFDFLKKAGSAIAKVPVMVKNSFFNTVLPLAQRGLELAKPVIREHTGNLVKNVIGTLPIPLSGPISDVAKKGVDWGLGKLLADKPKHPVAPYSPYDLI